MKVEIIKCSKPKGWYQDNIGETRKVKFSPYRGRFSLLRRFVKLFQIEDAELSSPGCGYLYQWKDVKLKF